MSEQKNIKVAVIDMNNGSPNQGMRGIKEILQKYPLDLTYDIFDIRQKGEVPGLDYDIFISSGGPGSPFDGVDSKWEHDFFNLLTEIENFNAHNEVKKYAFLICHSFQLACRKYGLGKVTKRKSNAFGIFPISLTEDGEQETIFKGLPNPFYSVDSRDWQVIQPKLHNFTERGAKILAIEKERPHVALERCVMAIRFSDQIIGTQFHPEADPIGMKMYLLQDEKKAAIIKNHGSDKYLDMLNSLDDLSRITLTQSVILPNFLDQAIHTLQEV
ncbi:type 1 glutamine amidotransferase [Pedobacter insulae]|uniref:GMP synthase-Glutamine amidotransferase n=1 Tax=Pedobacter insulae TaxID=414048 RepID=A0A1I2T4B9_9SPHI|nr:GMP synthase [Pedobacter insulae]SFG59690.1 GMP synthase-Glutamine amidotransferase [Pedobacter insulae]